MKMHTSINLSILAVILLTGCRLVLAAPEAERAAKVKPGVEVLFEKRLDLVRG
ncbi:hypothetical protein FJY63_01575, partial [Candidatus Sumerlaeota bacterium]|nr:hypothetical protein [Candidatus Sumerlaeota bacterium]